MKTLNVFLEASRGQDFKAKPFKIGKLQFKPVDRGLFTRTAMDNEFHSSDGMWKIIPGGYRLGVGAQSLNMNKSGNPDKRLTWSIWDESQGILIYTYASLPKAKKGLEDTLAMRSEGKGAGEMTREVTKEVATVAYELVKISEKTSVDMKELMKEMHRLLKKNGHKV